MRSWRWGAVLLLLLAVWPATARPVGAAMPPYRVERTLSLPVGGEVELHLSGSLLIWQETGPAGLTRLNGLDLRTNRRLPLPLPVTDQRHPALADPLLAWIETEPTREQDQLVVYDLEAQQRLLVTGPSAVPDHPALDGTTVVWRDQRDGRWALYGYDLVAGAEYLITSGDRGLGPPTIAGDYVVWSEYREGSWDIVAFQRSARRVFPLVTGPDDQVNPHLSDGRVVFEERPAVGGPPRLRLVGLDGNMALTLSSDHLVTAPMLDGPLVVWEDWRDGVSGIFVYDLESRQEIPITRAQQARQPVIDGQTVAWLNLNPVGALIAVAALRPILPSERRDPPLQPDPNVLYFPETGHTLGFGFKGFWQQQGGLPIFGYPLTEEFREGVSASGQPLVVQYFERFKLQYDASERDPARQVSVARLGADWLAGREPPRLDPIEDEADRRYFPETGHTLAGGFKRYWDDHDGQRLLGFPLTEEFSEGGRTVQYFERGRLELDPGIDDPRFRIAPGQLGREALVARGWLPSGSRPNPPPGSRPR